MDSFKKLKIGTQLTLGFGMLTALMLVLAVFSVVRVSALSKAFNDDNRIASEKLEPLYLAREALAQTGLAARNAYIFTDAAEANKELDIVDAQKAIYLKAVEQMAPAYANDPQFAKVKEGLLAMANELKRPRQYRDAGKMEEYGHFLVNECSPLRRRIVQDMAVLVTSAQKESEAATDMVEAYASGAQRMVTVLAVVAFILSVVIAGLIKRVLLKQLGGERCTRPKSPAASPRATCPSTCGWRPPTRTVCCLPSRACETAWLASSARCAMAPNPSPMHRPRSRSAIWTCRSGPNSRRNRWNAWRRRWKN